VGVIDFSSIEDGAQVTIDTAPLIYLFENNAAFLKYYLPLFERIEAGEIHGVLSVVTLAEVLAGPLKAGNEILADRYYRLLTNSIHWRIEDMNAELAFVASRIRANHNLKLPDAIQVATAIYSGSVGLVTHDRDFAEVKEIRIWGQFT